MLRRYHIIDLDVMRQAAERALDGTSREQSHRSATALLPPYLASSCDLAEWSER